MTVFNTASAKQTQKLAAEFARRLKGGEIVALRGNLGSGKTTFVKGVARALNIRKTVTSPTFVILKSYNFKKNGRRLTLNHFDCYRLRDHQGLSSEGILEPLENRSQIAFVEWPEMIWRRFPKKIISITFAHTKLPHKRKIKISAPQNYVPKKNSIHLK